MRFCNCEIFPKVALGLAQIPSPPPMLGDLEEFWPHLEVPDCPRDLENMREYVGYLKKYVKNIKKYKGNMKEYMKNMKK